MLRRLLSPHLIAKLSFSLSIDWSTFLMELLHKKQEVSAILYIFLGLPGRSPGLCCYLQPLGSMTLVCCTFRALQYYLFFQSMLITHF